MSDLQPKNQSPQKLSHIDGDGRAAMVDVGSKPVTSRRAVAEGQVLVGPLVAQAIRENTLKKGDLLQVARFAGIQAAKKTSDLILLCHPLLLTQVEVQVTLEGETVNIRATVRTAGQTGVEMEALTAVSVAALNVVDMGKALNPHIVIESMQVVEKQGGKTGSLSLGTASSIPPADFSVALLTISDSRSAGTAEDLATPQLVEAVRQFLGAEVSATVLIADDRQQIVSQLKTWIEADQPPRLILTTGGTGIGPHDVTPEATADVIEKPHPGLLELVHARCLPGKPHAFLSRAVAGVAKGTLIVNLPGSPRGAVDTLRLMSDVLPHALATLKDVTTDHPV